MTFVWRFRHLIHLEQYYNDNKNSTLSYLWDSTPHPPWITDSVLPKTRLPVLHFITDSMHLASVNLVQLALKVGTWYKISGQINAFDRECLYLSTSFRVNPWTPDWEIQPRTSTNLTLLHSAQNIWYTEPFRYEPPVWQTDAWTDRQRITTAI